MKDCETAARTVSGLKSALGSQEVERYGGRSREIAVWQEASSWATAAKPVISLRNAKTHAST